MATTDTPETNEPTSVFITAGNSGVAKTLVRKLVNAGYKVYATTDGTSGADELRTIGGIPVYPDLSRGSELASTIKMAKSTVLVQLPAGDANTPPFRAHEWQPESIRQNAEAAAHAAAATDTELLISISAAYLYANGGAPVDEQGGVIGAAGHPIVAETLAAEKAVRDSGVKSIILRAGYIYGGSSKGMQTVETTLRTGRPVLAGDQPAAFIHEDDLATAIFKAIETRPDVELLNIVDDEAVSTRAFLAELTQGMGVSMPTNVPGFLTGMFGGKTVQFMNTLGTAVSNAQAKEALDWSPRFATIKDGIAEMLLSWRAALSPEKQ